MANFIGELGKFGPDIRLIAVGSEFSTMIWTSADGESWSRERHDRAEFGESDGLTKVIAGGPGLVMIGRSADSQAIWVAAVTD